MVKRRVRFPADGLTVTVYVCPALRVVDEGCRPLSAAASRCQSEGVAMASWKLVSTLGGRVHVWRNTDRGAMLRYAVTLSGNGVVPRPTVGQYRSFRQAWRAATGVHGRLCELRWFRIAYVEIDNHPGVAARSIKEAVGGVAPELVPDEDE